MAERERRRRSLLWLRWVAAALVVLAAALFYVGHASLGTPLAFDALEWAAGRVNTGGWGTGHAEVARARMVDDLTASHLYLGMPYADAHRLLGEDDCGGGGQGTFSPGYRTSGYSLTLGPTVAQRVACWRRWRTGNPYLWLRFEPYASPKLVSISID